MEPQLLLQRIKTQSQSSSQNFIRVSCSRPAEVNPFSGVAKWDINHPFHLAMVGSMGILKTYTLETTRGGSKAYLYPCGSFQLHLDFGQSECRQETYEASHKIKSTITDKNDDAIASLCLGSGGKWHEEITRAQPVEKAWGSFEFIPQRPSEIVFFQHDSRRILFARLPGSSPKSSHIGERSSSPRSDSSKSRVYCVGRHSSTIMSIAVRGDGRVLVSAARDGYLKIWRICDHSMLAQTMFSRWRQPRSPKQGKTSAFSTNHVEAREMDHMSSAMQVVKFLGNSWHLCMGCPNGEVRMWSMKKCEEGDRLTITEAGNLPLGKEVISSLALHVPDCNFPMQSNNDIANQTQELIATGTLHRNLHVWRKPTALEEWIPLWSTTLSVEAASIVSLSFRADGGLLAVAVSRIGKPIALAECNSHNRCKPSSSEEQPPGDRLYLYNTASWACVGWLSFTSSHLGSCLFYHPHFQVEDRSEPRSQASQVKVASCRLLLVSTSGGPQAHILPEYGLFGSLDQCEQYEMTHLNCRKEEKNVHWADLRRGLGPQFHVTSHKKELQELSKVEGEGDGSGRCDPTPLPVEVGIATKPGLCSSVLDIHCNKTPPKTAKRWPKQELPYEQIGLQSLRRATSKKCKSHHQCHHHKLRSKMHPRRYVFKERKTKLRSLEADAMPRSHAIVKRHKSKKPLPFNFASRTCQHCRKHSNFGFCKQDRIATSSSYPSSFNQATTSLPTPRRVENIDPNQAGSNAGNNANVASVEKSRSRTPAKDATTLNKEDQMPPTHALRLRKLEDLVNPKVKKVVTFFAPKTPKVIPRHIGSSLEGTISQSRGKGEEGHLGAFSTNVRPCSKQESLNNHDQGRASTQHTTQDEQRCDLSGTQSHHRIGGGELHELLVMTEDSSPFKNMVRLGGTFREMSPQSKALVVRAKVDPSKTSEEKLEVHLNSPKAFSTANLMQRLQDIEHETFDLDAALEVAKAKGIVLSKHDRAELRAALEEERREGPPKSEPSLEGQQSTARYIPLLKIPDPRISYNGPFIAPRKVKKQIDIKGEDMSTIQPALFDLWDLHDRCPQVSSANLEQANTFSVSSWRRSLGSLRETNRDSVWVQREDVCQAAGSAQSMYDSCLCRRTLEPQCHCYEGDQEIFNIHVK